MRAMSEGWVGGGNNEAGGAKSEEDEAKEERLSRAGVVSVEEAFPRCRDDFRRWVECVKRNPEHSPTSSVCNRFATSLGWCVTLSLCPGPARRLEHCCGGVPELVRCKMSQCRRENVQLDQCMQKFT